MEAVQKRAPSSSLKRYLSTRRGAVTAAICAAILAGVVLVAFLQQYKNNVKNGTEAVPVLVAQRLIPAGTAGDVVAASGFFKPSTVSRDDRKIDAVASAAALAGMVATHDIYPGQQITLADFAAGADAVRSKIQGDQRAIAVSMDAEHGITALLRAGDRVDILYATGTGNGAGAVTRTLMQNVLVLEPAAGGGGSVILQLSDRDAAKLAFARDNGQIWFELRPPVGAKQGPPVSVTLQTIAGGH